MSAVQRFIGPLIVLALVVAGVFAFTGGDDKKTVTAFFPRTISLYEGSDVRVLGVAVGKIETVKPEGTTVKVVIEYDQTVDIPADAQAVIISPAIVGDRFVQLIPAYTGGEVIEDGAVIENADTQVPLELDEIYSSLNRLNLALGPNGANSEGALNDLLKTTAQSFRGQGAKFNQTIKDFSRFSETLDNNKDELFDSTRELGNFIETLANNDETVRQFNDSLGQVSTLLAGEREELSSALANLSVALGEVNNFVKTNRDSLGRNIKNINRVAKVLVKQRKNLNEVLETAPLALNNLALTYNPDAGTLDTNANIGELVGDIESDPGAVLCALVQPNDPTGAACDLIDTLPLPRPGTFGAAQGSSSGAVFDNSLGGLVEATP
ncbi:MCE family protein [Nocardioides salsibiostraticola]